MVGPTILHVSEPAKESTTGQRGRVPADSAGVMPAASVILLRDADPGSDASGVEVLLLRRTAKASFAADAWVFPGGRIDPEDGADPLSLETARTAAVRETVEEAGIAVPPDSLVPFSQWCPPPESPKRFLTWFFVARSPLAGRVAVDGGEITEHDWVRPSSAIAARDRGEVTLLPPTWVTLKVLESHVDVESVLKAAAADDPPYFETHIAFIAREDDPAQQDVVALWDGDAGYDSRDPVSPGPRHRLRMGDAPWQYEFTA